MKNQILWGLYHFLIGLFFCQLAVAQENSTSQEIEYKIYSQDKIKQLEYFAAAVKLCSEYDYKTTFGNRRYSGYNDKGERIDIRTVCVSIIPNPFINPLEFYAHHFEDDQRISKNQTNAFKLRSLRNEIEEKFGEKFRKIVASVDVKKLISYDVVRATIQDYDFNSKKLRVSYSVSANIGISKHSQKIMFPKLSDKNQIYYDHYIDLPEETAEKIYEYYASINTHNSNPPFNLNTKTTFGIYTSSNQADKNQIHAVVDKIEFFIQDNDRIDQKNKLGELLFNKTVFLNRYKRKFQIQKQE